MRPSVHFGMGILASALLGCAAAPADVSTPESASEPAQEPAQVGSDAEQRALDALQAPGARRIAEGMEPAWSPDGRWIIISKLDGDQRDLLVVRPDGSEQRRITDTSDSELLPTWAPDGRLAFVMPTKAGLRLLIMDEPLADVQSIREMPPPGLAPAFTSAPWTPSGEGLTVVTGTYPELDIYTVPLDGAAPSPLVRSPGYDASPAWSADGQLAFVSDRAGSRDIWTLSPGGELRQVTSGDSRDGDPAWSPDGRWIAFVSDRSGATEIHVVASTGGSLRRLTAHGARVGYPGWSPDGSMISYTLVAGGRTNDEVMVMPAPEGMEPQLAPTISASEPQRVGGTNALAPEAVRQIGPIVSGPAPAPEDHATLLAVAYVDAWQSRPSPDVREAVARTARP